ncbi:uncharacterized protein LOC120848329 isoform X2 [Ixodes scapularis]|uniref:uncharacterized protein LOC120848329 isoform X2 n=1 Tax=Ixodes scapularis TaxID=6945 RepID=UPI001A9D7443|nr:uncharacterized protein LOC120848329 isoform X2 [Ixodes scapularis]
MQDPVPSSSLPPPQPTRASSSRRRRRVNKTLPIVLDVNIVNAMFRAKRVITRSAKQPTSTLPIHEELPDDWDMLTFKLVLPGSVIKKLIHLTVFYAVHATESDELIKPYLPYLEVKAVKDIQEKPVALDLITLLKKTIDELNTKILQPLTRESDRSKLFYYRSGTDIASRAHTTLQPIILTTFSYEPTWSMGFNLFNGYTTPLYYPYHYTVSKGHGQTIGRRALLEYFLIPALTSYEVRSNIRDVLIKTPSDQQDAIVERVIKTIKALCTLPVFQCDVNLWESVGKFVEKQKDDLEAMKELISRLCAHPNIWENPQAYATGVQTANSRVPRETLREFLTNIFFSRQNTGNQHDTSLLEASFFFYVTYKVIKFKKPMVCTFIIECTNVDVLAAFYMRMRAILDPYNMKLNTAVSLFMVRHNIESITDANLGTVNATMKRAQAGKRTAIGFSHVSRYTPPNSKITSRGNRKIYIFHLTHSCESSKEDAFANRFLNPQAFADMFSTLLSIYSEKNMDITNSTIHEWSNRYLSEVFDSVHIFNKIIPSSSNFPATSNPRRRRHSEMDQEDVGDMIEAKIQHMTDSTNPWANGEEAVAAEDAQWLSTLDSAASPSRQYFTHTTTVPSECPVPNERQVVAEDKGEGVEKSVHGHPIQ